MESGDFTLGKPLIHADQIRQRVAALGREISERYADSDLLAVTVLRGGFVFAADLLRQLSATIDVQVDFLKAGSYGDRAVSSGEVKIETGLPTRVGDRHVLIVEDIVDTGRTLDFVGRRLAGDHAATVRTVALLEKDVPKANRASPDYVGFEIPNVFVVGYGLDYRERYRHLPDIHVLDPPARAETGLYDASEST